MRKLTKKENMDSRMNVVLNKFKTRITSYPPGMCPLVLYRSLLQMSMNQSCGKCVPCRDGLVEVERLLNSILKGEGSDATLSKMKELCIMIMQTADCAVGVVAANMILHSMEEFADEYKSHIASQRCVENTVQTVPCITLCPAHVNVPGYIALINAGRYADAVNLIRDRNPFPTACAMVCEHPCENKCRRQIIDEPINIRGLKKFAVDQVNAREVKPPKANVKTGKKIAIVGGGPSGLTCAYYLAMMGHKAVIFEEHEKLGGMLRYGIPEYRLPKEKLAKNHPGTPIMHVGKPVRGKALLYPAAYKASTELPDEEYPFFLTTGRILYQYNAAAMTSRAPGLNEIAGEGFIEVNYKDAEKLGFKNGEKIKVSSRRGSITAVARVGRKCSEGETWMPFHFPDSPANVLTNAALDDFARIPEYKVCAVRMEKIR